MTVVCLRIAAATTALLALAGVAVHSLTKTSSAGTDFYTMKREVMETEYCTANDKTCLAIFYDLESRLYTGDSRRQLQTVDLSSGLENDSLVGIESAVTCWEGGPDITVKSLSAPSDGFSFDHEWDYTISTDKLNFILNGEYTYEYYISVSNQSGGETASGE